MAEDILIPIGLFGSVFGILYVYFTTRNKERLALIEKGADASLFNYKRNKFTALKYGMLLAGLGLGLLGGNILAETTRLKEEIAYFSMTLFGGGVSLILFYLIERNISKD